MVQIIQEQGSLSGRLGKGFAKGLSEELPKGIAQGRLSYGLEQLGKQGANLSPTQQMAQLMRSGASAQEVSQLYPVVREAQQMQAYKQRQTQKQDQQAQKQAGQIDQPSAVGVEDGKTPQKQMPQKSILAGPLQIKNFKQSLLQEPSSSDIKNLAQDYMASGVAQNIQQAETMANQELNQNLSSQRQKLADFSTGLNQRIALDLQKGGLGNFQDVAGEIQNALLDQGQYLVGAKGFTPQAAEKEIGDITRELGKTANKTKETGAWQNWLKSSKEKTRELKDQKKKYQEYGFGEIFDDLATSAMGITPMQTAAILDPLENKELNKILSPLESTIFVDVRPLPEKKLDDIITHIKPDDNLLSIAHSIRDKRYDVDQFFQRISQLEDEGKIALTERQRRQREKPASNSMLGDVLFNIF